jgi:hypothetical protein
VCNHDLYLFDDYVHVKCNCIKIHYKFENFEIFWCRFFLEYSGVDFFGIF